MKTETQQDVRPETKPLAAGPDDWLCSLCLSKIADDRNRFLYDNRSEFAFKNPYGQHFDIITFSDASGCVEISEPTTDYTWFPGHTWSICLCAKCKLQMGWKFVGKFSFYGLIRRHLVLASAITN